MIPNRFRLFQGPDRFLLVWYRQNYTKLGLYKEKSGKSQFENEKNTINSVFFLLEIILAFC